jgi:hypothetical protein
MPCPLPARSAAFERRIMPLHPTLIRLATALALAVLTQGCSGAPTSPFVGPEPSNPFARTPPAAYRSTIDPYVSRRPAEPDPWRQQNERVAPSPKPDP